MSVASITAVVVYKSLWWILPMIGGIVVMAVTEAREEAQDAEIK